MRAQSSGTTLSNMPGRAVDWELAMRIENQEEWELRLNLPISLTNPRTWHRVKTDWCGCGGNVALASGCQGTIQPPARRSSSLSSQPCLHVCKSHSELNWWLATQRPQPWRRLVKHSGLASGVTFSLACLGFGAMPVLPCLCYQACHCIQQCVLCIYGLARFETRFRSRVAVWNSLLLLCGHPIQIPLLQACVKLCHCIGQY